MKIFLTIFITIIFSSLGYLFFIQKQLINRISVLESQSPYFSTTASPEKATEQDIGQKKAVQPVLIGFREISGSVSEIKNNRLVVLAIVPMIVDFSNPIPPLTVERTYTVSISKTTVLNKISASNPEKPISLSGLKEIQVGDFISISASEDLQNKTEFTAKEITLFSK